MTQFVYGALHRIPAVAPGFILIAIVKFAGKPFDLTIKSFKALHFKLCERIHKALQNIAGQVLLSFAFMEQWYLWILVNISSISLWAVALLSGTGSGNASVMLIKYIFYLMNSINGLRIWLNLCKEPAFEGPATSDLDN